MYFFSQKISIFMARFIHFNINDFLAAILAMASKEALPLLLATLIALPPFAYNPLPAFGNNQENIEKKLLAQTYVQNNLVTNGPVYDIKVANGRAYIAGSFTQVGPNVGSGVPFDLTTGNLASKFPKVDRAIRAVVPDVSGGWYIGGDFTQVGFVRRNGLAHILSDGTTSTTTTTASTSNGTTSTTTTSTSETTTSTDTTTGNGRPAGGRPAEPGSNGKGNNK
jgi:hypothetical protein